MSLSATASSFDPYSALSAVVQPPPVRQGLYEDNVWYESNVPPHSITAVRFDPYEEVLWTGTAEVRRFIIANSQSKGRVVSYLMPDATKYTCWFAHESSQYGTGSVSELLVNSEGRVRDSVNLTNSGVISLSCSGVKYSTRGGRTKSSYL
jgi:hypothetical protein